MSINFYKITQKWEDALHPILPDITNDEHLVVLRNILSQHIQDIELLDATINELKKSESERKDNFYTDYYEENDLNEIGGTVISYNNLNDGMV